MTTTGGRESWRTQKTAQRASSLRRSCKSGGREQMHYNHRKNCTFFSRGDHYLQYLSSVLIFTTTVYLWQAGGMHSHGEDQAGAAGQLHLVWKEEEAVQRQVFGKTQRRYTVHSDA